MNELAGVAEKNALSVEYEVLGTKVNLDLDFVKKYLVRGSADLVSDQEVVFFMNLCKMQKLNPLTGSDVYLIKYSKNDPAQMVVGKSAYMRRAFEHPDYLCKEDGIVVQRGNQIIQKEGCCLYPGETLIGGWCRVHYMRQGKEREAYKEVALSEYDKGMANWKSKPALMVNKVAVSQCVREAFPKDYDGLYSEDELLASGQIPANYDQMKNSNEVVVEAEVVDNSTRIRDAFMAKVSEVYADYDPNKKREVSYSIMRQLGIDNIREMTEEQLSQAMELVDQEWAKENQKDPNGQETAE